MHTGCVFLTCLDWSFMVTNWTHKICTLTNLYYLMREQWYKICFRKIFTKVYFKQKLPNLQHLAAVVCTVDIIVFVFLLYWCFVFVHIWFMLVMVWWLYAFEKVLASCLLSYVATLLFACFTGRYMYVRRLSLRKVLHFGKKTFKNVEMTDNVMSSMFMFTSVPWKGSCTFSSIDYNT